MTFNPAAVVPAERSKIERDDWEVPTPIFRAQNAIHHFTIDVAANAANRVVPRYFDREQNGLTQSWLGERVWMHPPHGEAALWAAKALTEASRGVLVVALLPARTYEPWWHDLVFPRASVQFLCGHMPWRLKGIPLVAGQRVVDEPRGGFAIVTWHVADVERRRKFENGTLETVWPFP